MARGQFEYGRKPRISTYLVSVLLLMTGCGGGGSGTGQSGSTCERFGYFSPGESAQYRLKESNGLEYLLTVTATEITDSRARFHFDEQEVTTGAFTGFSDADLPRGCPYVEPLFLTDRQLLVLGLPNAWGSSLAGISAERTESCEPAVRSTDSGDFSVDRCQKWFTVAGLDGEPFEDDFVNGAGSPGSGFVARTLVRDLTGSPSAVLVHWSGGR